jgi:TolB protein
MIRFILFFLLTINIFAIDAQLTIEKDVDSKASISLVEDEFSANSSRFHKKMFELLINDMKLSGHFNTDTSYHKAGFDNIMTLPQLHDKEYILKYSFAPSADRLNIKLIKVFDNSIIFEKKYNINNSQRFPFLAHNAIVDINKALNYEDISWMKRNIIFSKYTTPRNSEIWIADYTLTFSSIVVRGGLNLFPKWANQSQNAFYYTSYNNLLPTLYRIDMRTGNKKKIVSSPGMLVCSDVSKDGKKLLLTMAPKGQPDIYQYTIGKGLKRLTKFGGIDVNAKYAGDESQIVFVSNRMGKPNIYLKSIGYDSVSKIPQYGNYNSSCDVFDKYIVYSVKEGRNVNIYLGSIYDLYVRPLTSNGINILPRFSNDGRVILYIKKHRGKNSIGYMNLATNTNMLYPMINGRIQSIDW